MLMFPLGCGFTVRKKLWIGWIEHGVQSRIRITFIEDYREEKSIECRTTR